ncbi:M48 family metallopeptidase [bacterium]|nr:M48 family metallopeptidase [bacterium]
MWELIRINKRKSLFVLILMFVLMVSFSAAVGAGFYYADYVTGMLWGALIGVLLWAVQAAVAYYAGDDIVLRFNMAVVVTPESYPQLYNIVEEMKIAAGLQFMPEIYIVQSPGLNAFATGIRREKTAICVTSGLVENLTRDELQGVIAHEISHILNRDVLFMTFAGVMLGTITMLSKFMLRGSVFANSDCKRSQKKGGIAGGHPAIILVVLLFAVVAPILARIFYFTISKKREYLADASAARLTRYPIGLASALHKIAAHSSVSFVSKITAPMFIVNPQFTGGDEDSVFSGSTHPPLYKRIAILTQLQHGGKVSLENYQKIYEKELETSGLFSKTTLESDKSEAVRAESTEKINEFTESRKDVADVILANTGFKIITCECGLKIKLPPSDLRMKVLCPRCARELSVSSPDTQVQAENGEDGLVFIRKNKNSWESFPCRCGKFTFQLSPLFRGTYVVCKRCKTKVKIEYPS